MTSNLLPHLFLAISQFFCLCNLVLLQNAFLQQGSLKLTFSLKLLKNGRGVVYSMCNTMFSNIPHICKDLLRRRYCQCKGIPKYMLIILLVNILSVELCILWKEPVLERSSWCNKKTLCEWQWWKYKRKVRRRNNNAKVCKSLKSFLGWPKSSIWK